MARPPRRAVKSGFIIIGEHFFGTGSVAQPAKRTSFDELNRHGAASCRSATRPVPPHTDGPPEQCPPTP
jgi:hypothetical protein